MLRTIKQCNDALAYIDRELKRLMLERIRVIKIREFLEAQPSESPKILRDTKTSVKIYQIIEENPGVSGQRIREILNDGTPPKIISYTLSNMRASRKIENRGKSNIGEWYIKE